MRQIELNRFDLKYVKLWVHIIEQLTVKYAETIQGQKLYEEIPKYGSYIDRIVFPLLYLNINFEKECEKFILFNFFLDSAFREIV